MDREDQTTALWGWNGDMCAIWGEAIILGETREEKERRARLFAAAPGMLAVLKLIAGGTVQSAQKIAADALADMEEIDNAT